MINLYWTETAILSAGGSGGASLSSRGCVAKKLVIVEQAGNAAAECEFRDGGVNGRIVARLRVAANGTFVLAGETNESFVFRTDVTVVGTAGTLVAGMYTMGNPNPTFA